MSIDSLAVGMPMEAQIAMLWKRASKLFDRIDRLFSEISPYVPNADRHVNTVKGKLKYGDYYMYDSTDKKQYLRQINFEQVALDLSERCYGEPRIELLPAKIRHEFVYERAKQNDERLELLKREHIRDLEKRNDLPQISGKWRKEPYPVRVYERLTNYVPASLTASVSGLISTNTNDNPENLNSLELKQLDTDLEGYLGQPYNYNDGELTEEWMSSFQDLAPSGGDAAASAGATSSGSGASKDKDNGNGKATKKKKGAKGKENAAAQAAAAAPKQKPPRGGAGLSLEDKIIRPTLDDVIRIQLENVMEVIKIQVQDRVCTENKILTAVPPVDIGDVLKEVPVWGVDSYARRMIEIAIEDNSAVYKAMLSMPDSVSAPAPVPVDPASSGSCSESKAVSGAVAVSSDSAGSHNGEIEDEAPLKADPLERPAAAASSCNATARGTTLCTESIIYFIESVALPSINTLDSSDAHDMRLVMRAILDQCDPSNPNRLIRNYRSFVADFAAAVLLGIDQYGIERFRIHPKGTGVVVCEPTLQNDRNMNTVDCVGIPPHVVICRYLGELHLPYRWCEKLDVVEQAQQIYNLKPTLPDFYNILLERPRHDKGGYGLLYVDASQRANMGSSCSHSCNANCTSNVVSRNGKLCIVLTTNRWIYPGEELSMDYYSVTNSEVEWRASICLCGTKNCRGTFLHYAAQDDLQQVLTRNCGILWRYATLLRACSLVPLSSFDKKFLSEHGMGETVFGFNSPRRKEEAAVVLRGTHTVAESARMDLETNDAADATTDDSYDYAGVPDWVLKYASDNLRFIEYERKALPMALMRTNNASKQGLFAAGEASAPGALPYTFTEADIEARSVMEQRIQSFVSCYSMIMQVLDGQKRVDVLGYSDLGRGGQPECSAAMFPLRPLPVSDAIVRVHEVLSTVPLLLHKYIVTFYEARAAATKEAAAAAAKELLAKDENAVNGTTATATEPKKKSPGKKGSASLGGSGNSVTGPVGAVSLHADVNSEEAVREATRVIMELHILLGIDNRNPRYAPPFSPSKPTVVVCEEPAVDTDVTAQMAVESEPAELKEPADFVPPKGFAAMRRLILGVRTLVESLVKYSTTEARLLLLCDMLVLWANTSHYSMVKAYDPVQSEPIRVVARELGTNISRNKLTQAKEAKEAQVSRAERASQRAAAAVNAREEELLMEVIRASMDDAAANDNSGTPDAPVAGSDSCGTPDAPATRSDSSVVSGTGSGVTISAPSPSTSDGNAASDSSCAAGPQSAILDANELVFEGRKVYDQYFSFWQLMQWFNAGTDDKVTESDLFGCVQLPLPGACFGPTAGSAVQSVHHTGKDKTHSSSHYSVKSPQRKTLLELISNERLQINPWPTALKECFNGLYGSLGDLPVSFGRSSGSEVHDAATACQIDWYQHAIMGSPLLDISLGQMDALLRVRQDFAASLTETNSAVDTEKVDIFAKLQTRNDMNASNSHANSQFDSVLPPELPAQWIQCDLCKKWRRIAWHIDHNIEQDRETWTCANNTWDPEKAFCEAELDWFDADAENTLNVGNAGGEGELACGSTNLEDYKVGTWFDVFCNRNLLYYEAKVVAHKQPRGPAGTSEQPLPQVQFNFKGWGKRFGEWIEVGSERIQHHNLFTTPTEHGNAMAITKIQMEWQATNGTLLSSSVGVLAGQDKVFANKKKKAAKAQSSEQGKGSGKPTKKQKTK